jgi:CRISPR system Cascade subunit CasC
LSHKRKIKSLNPEIIHALEKSMPDARFVQIHWLASYPGVLLNRDDAGLAKRLKFGSATRLRVSSQAIKRRLRIAEDSMSLREISNVPVAERSKHLIRRKALDGLEAQSGLSAEDFDKFATIFEKALYGDKGDKTESRQALLLGWPEIRFLREKALEFLGDGKDPKSALLKAEAFGAEFKGVMKQMRAQTQLPGGIEAALFGRMITSDTQANIDAAVHVAHALTVHEAETEIDYVTAVDDLASDEETGAAGIFDAELTSGVYYNYIVVDVPGLVSNLEGVDRKEWAKVPRDLAGEVASRLVHLTATVSPGAKKGSTAPYSFADTMLLEVGSRQPRTLANAFIEPIPLRGDIIGTARTSLLRELAAIDADYGTHETRRIMARGDVKVADLTKVSLLGLAEFARASILEGRA